MTKRFAALGELTANCVLEARTPTDRWLELSDRLTFDYLRAPGWGRRQVKSGDRAWPEP